MGIPDICCKENKVCFKFCWLTEIFLVIKNLHLQYFKGTVHIKNIKEDNSWQGKLNTRTQEVELVVELYSDIMKTIQSLQVDLQSFRDDNLNERKEHQEINEALLWKMMGGSPPRKPIHSTNWFKEEPYHKWASNQREEGKEEHTQNLQKEIITVLLVMSLFLHVEINR